MSFPFSYTWYTFPSQAENRTTTEKTRILAMKRFSKILSLAKFTSSSMGTKLPEPFFSSSIINIKRSLPSTKPKPWQDTVYRPS